jgi:hypothetical protein
MLLAARCRADVATVDALHGKLGLRSRRAYGDDAVQAMKDAKRDVVPAVSSFTLAGQHVDAARLAVSELEGREPDVTTFFQLCGHPFFCCLRSDILRANLELGSCL